MAIYLNIRLYMLIFCASLIYCILQLYLIRFNNKNEEDFEDNSIHKQKPVNLIWRSLKEFNLTELQEKNCRNSVQGIKLIVDDRGFVCKREDLLKTGCCNLESPHTRLHFCDTCNDQNCCEIYEYCVSCCLDPEKVPDLEKLIAEATDRQNLLYSSTNDHFEFCLAKCRTSSHSLKHENKYRDVQHRFCYGKTTPDKSIIPVI
jgi:hypothetical protein